MAFVVKLKKMDGGELYATGDVWRSTVDIEDAKLFATEEQASNFRAGLNSTWKDKATVEMKPVLRW